jgi:pantoate kinase
MKLSIPHHISGLWIPVLSTNPLFSGSVGAGLNISISSIAFPVENECVIRLNDQEVFHEQARDVCEFYGTKIGVAVKSPFNLGKGFALSSTLLIAHNLTTSIYTGSSLLKAFQKAHELEVLKGTGLGDVISQYYGGFVIRTRPGPPGIGEAFKIPVKYRVKLIVSSLPYHEPTSRMLERIPLSHYEKGLSLLRRVVKSEDLIDYFNAAREYTQGVFDYSKIPEEILHSPGVVGLYLKKSALIIWVENDRFTEIADILSRRGFFYMEGEISKTGVEIEHTF